MPTVILLDISTVVKKHNNYEQYRPLQMALNGIDIILDQIQTAAPLEYIAVATHTHSFEVITQFTKEIPAIKSDLSKLKVSDKFNVIDGLKNVEKLIVNEWGSGHSCNVIVVTLESSIDTSPLPIPFQFPGNLIFVSLIPDMIRHSHPNQNKWIKFKVDIFHPEPPATNSNIQQMFTAVAEKYYSLWIGNLTCGYFNSKISLTPSPEPYLKVTDFDCATFTMEQQIDICGFIELQHVGSPGAVSRHLVLPYSIPSPFAQRNYGASTSQGSGLTDSSDESQDEGQVPSFCVLLHGALKVENMAALCQVAPSWYGVLFSWADSKKKCNLMLSLLEPGPEPVPWLGDLNNLTIKMTPQMEVEAFPIKTVEKKSYAANCVAWIRQAGFQTDIQKILRHARKIPEKTLQFYKELNRVRKAAICLGFLPLIDGLASILERECTTLPGSIHPSCAFQLSHAAGILREPCARDPKFVILPLKMSF